MGEAAAVDRAADRLTPERRHQGSDVASSAPVAEGPSVESDLLRLQRSAGNAAVMHLIAGRSTGPMSTGHREGIHVPLSPTAFVVQRAPARAPAIQRAPAAATERLDPKARAERVRQAITYYEMPVQAMKIDIEDVASALDGMTRDEGREVARVFEERTHWNLQWLIIGELEIGDRKIPNDIGPFNRRRLLNLLAGPVAAPEIDPLAAQQTGAALGEFVGSFVGRQEEFGLQAGAAAAVTANVLNLAEQKRAATKRLVAQAIEVKVWIDKGEKDKLFALLRKLATPATRDERHSLSDAYQEQFGEGLYIALTKRFKSTDWERVGALFDEDTAKDDRLVTEARVQKLEKAEAAVPKAPEWAPKFAEQWVAAQPATQVAQRQVREDRTALEAHLNEMAQEPAKPDQPEGKSRLEASLDVSAGATPVRKSLAAQKNVVVDELLSKDRRPEMLAARLARSEREGTLKASEVEGALRELRATADADARRKAAEGSPDKPAVDPSLLVDSYFAQFRARFNADARRPLELVLGSTGSSEERGRNVALLGSQGVLPEWQELYFALQSDKKDMDRVRSILEPKTRSQIQVLAADYQRFTPDHRNLSTDLLGTAEQVKGIVEPDPRDRMRGKGPKDIGAAREELDEKKRLLAGGVFEAGPLPGGAQDLESLAHDLAMTRDLTRMGYGGAGRPAPDAVIADAASAATTRRDVEQLRQEAWFVFGRISGSEIAVDYNRGLFARARDAMGNVEHQIVQETKDDTLTALRALDEATLKDVPDLDTARRQVNELYLVQARMKHNLTVYKDRTEEAFNAFVDAVVLIASTLATMGEGGAILMAIRATAATVATKAIAKGSAYGAAEFWGDIKGGVYSAIGGKLAEGIVGGATEAIAVRYARRAERLGLTKSLGTWLVTHAGSAAKWEAENLVSGVASGTLEAADTGDVRKITTPMSLESHLTAVGQHAAHAGYRKIQPGRPTHAPERPGRRPEGGESKAAAGEAVEPEVGPAKGPREPEIAGQPSMELAPGAAPAATPKEVAPRAASEPSSQRPAKPLGGEGSRSGPPKPPGGPIDPVATRQVPEGTSSTLQQFADNHDLVIKVRPMNPEAIARLEGRREVGGAPLDQPAMPKMEIVKAKSIVAEDEYIGGPADSRGLVALFEPRLPAETLPPDAHARAMERYKTRSEEWANRQKDYGQYIESGVMRIEGGLILMADPRVAGGPGAPHGEFRRVAGDVDLFDIRHADGTRLSPDEMNYVERRLRSMGIGIEHGALEWWQTQHRESFEKNQDVYNKLVQEHSSKTPLVAYVPKESAQSVWAETEIRRRPRRDRPGDRIIPLKEPSVVVSSEYRRQVEAAGERIVGPGEVPLAGSEVGRQESVGTIGTETPVPSTGTAGAPASPATGQSRTSPPPATPGGSETASLSLHDDAGSTGPVGTMPESQPAKGGAQTDKAPAKPRAGGGPTPGDAVPGGVTVEDDGYATTVRSRQDPKALVRIEVEGRTFKLTDIYRRSLPAGSGANLLAEGLRVLKAAPGQQMLIHGIINPETVETHKQGGEARDSKLAKTAERALEIVGLSAREVRWEIVRSKLCIVLEF